MTTEAEAPESHAPDAAKPDDFFCVVDAVLLARAHTMVHKSPRYVLNGVHIAPCPAGGALLTATDGSMLVVLRDPLGLVRGSGATVTPWSALLTACRERRVLKPRLFVASAERAAITDRDREAIDYDFLATPDASTIAFQWRETVNFLPFPNWRKAALPTEFRPDAAPGVIDASRLLTLAKALGSAFGKPSVRLIATGTDEFAPILVLSGREGFGVLMPMRDIVERGGLPKWLDGG